jgi:hypothetical protein
MYLTGVVFGTCVHILVDRLHAERHRHQCCTSHRPS